MQYNFVTQEYLELIAPEEAKFIFEQGEKHLKDQIDTSQQIGTKTTTLLTVVSGLMIGLVGFGITRLASSGFDELITTTIGSCIYLYVIGHMLLNNVKPSVYKSIGLHPRDLFHSNVFNDRNKAYRLKAIYVNEIIECQKRIDFNNDTNNARWKRFNKALRLVSYSPGLFLGLYLAIHFFSRVVFHTVYLPDQCCL